VTREKAEHPIISKGHAITKSCEDKVKGSGIAFTTDPRRMTGVFDHKWLRYSTAVKIIDQQEKQL